ncbi:MAG: TIGR02391 family protein [Jatrophihabitans sp.]
MRWCYAFARDGRKLGRSNPRIRLADLKMQTERVIQQCLHFLSKGAVQSIRNLHAHEQIKPLGEEEGR